MHVPAVSKVQGSVPGGSRLEIISKVPDSVLGSERLLIAVQQSDGLETEAFNSLGPGSETLVLFPPSRW